MNVRHISLFIFLLQGMQFTLQHYGNLPYITLKSRKTELANSTNNTNKPESKKEDNAEMDDSHVEHQDEGEDLEYHNDEEVHPDDQQEYHDDEEHHEDEHYEDEHYEDEHYDEGDEHHDEDYEYEEEEHPDEGYHDFEEGDEYYDDSHQTHEQFHPHSQEHVEEQPVEGEEYMDANIEHEEIAAALELVEYKMTEVNELIKECISIQFAENLMATEEEILTECSGLTFQILYRNYEEALLRVKQIFMELIRIKLSELDPEYDDEIQFFLDLFENFLGKDFHLRKSLKIGESSAQYYVSVRFYESLMEMCSPEISAIHKLHVRLQESRASVKDLVHTKVAERQAYLDSLKEQTEVVEEHMEAPVVHHGEVPDEEPLEPLQEEYEEEPYEEEEYEEEPYEEEGEHHEEEHHEEVPHEQGDYVDEGPAEEAPEEVPMDHEEAVPEGEEEQETEEPMEEMPEEKGSRMDGVNAQIDAEQARVNDGLDTAQQQVADKVDQFGDGFDKGIAGFESGVEGFGSMFGKKKREK